MIKLGCEKLTINRVGLTTYGGKLFKLISCWAIENVAVITVCEAISYRVDQLLTQAMQSDERLTVARIATTYKILYWEYVG